MEYIDFSNCKISKIYYGGTDKKLGIIFEGQKYFLKFKKDLVFQKRNNHLSEYIGSHIYELLGFKVHKTYLGFYKKEEVVACKDFVSEGYQFVPFNDLGESTIEVSMEKIQYSYKDIIKILENNKKLTNINETISIFFDMFIVDALIGNFDRHGANWGFLKKDNKYQLAPIFDNGSSLFPNLVNEDEMNLILNDEEEINRRVYKFPTSQIKINNQKSSYFDVISSLKFKECNDALIRIYKKINMDQIFNLIDELNISNLHKTFYKRMLNERYNKIIKYSYNKLVGINNGI